MCGERRSIVFHVVVVDCTKKTLWEHYDRRVILENLNTTNLSEAQTRRWYYVAKWRDSFRRATNGETLTPEEIEAEAQAVYGRVLRGLREVEPTDLNDGDDPVMTSLKMALMEVREVLGRAIHLLGVRHRS